MYQLVSLAAALEFGEKGSLGIKTGDFSVALWNVDCIDARDDTHEHLSMFVIILHMIWVMPSSIESWLTVQCLLLSEKPCSCNINKEAL